MHAEGIAPPASPGGAGNLKRIVRTALATAALLVTAAVVSPAAHADQRVSGPILLTDEQMDMTTAGLAGVFVGAGAFASGDWTFAWTDTRTRAREAGPLDIAFGIGRAMAISPDEHDVVLETATISDGEPLFSFSRTVEVDKRFISLGITVVLVIDH